MHKKFEINRTKIKGMCQSGRKVVTYNSKSDLPLVQFSSAEAAQLSVQSGSRVPHAIFFVVMIQGDLTRSTKTKLALIMAELLV